MQLSEAFAGGRIGPRLWFYTNFHCNLRCRYCLTSSHPSAPRRELETATILESAEEAVALGFASFGVTGGEPFLRPEMPEVLTELGARLPTVVLTNASFVGPRLLDRLAPLAALPVALQVSLDSGCPETHDAQRGPGDHARVVAALAALRERGVAVRIGTTTDGTDPDDLERLCELHRRLGIGDEDHVVRPLLRRGRALAAHLGADVAFADLPPELTLTAEGAFWSPAAPTVRDERLDIDLLLTRATRPLAVPLAAMLRVAGAQPARDGLPRVA